MADDTRDLPDLFKATNLQFTTKKANRTPTFYFDDGTDTGRLRTAHGNGPKKYEDANRRTHYFFQLKTDRDNFYNNVKDGQTVSSQGGTPEVRTEGYYHCEFEIGDNDKKIPGTLSHPSSGTLVLNAGDFSDADLKKIYNRIMDKVDAGDTSDISWAGLPAV